LFPSEARLHFNRAATDTGSVEGGGFLRLAEKENRIPQLTIDKAILFAQNFRQRALGRLLSAARESTPTQSGS
jgi:hypothetical protein